MGSCTCPESLGLLLWPQGPGKGCRQFRGRASVTPHLLIVDCSVSVLSSWSEGPCSRPALDLALSRPWGRFCLGWFPADLWLWRSWQEEGKRLAEAGGWGVGCIALQCWAIWECPWVSWRVGSFPWPKKKLGRPWWSQFQFQLLCTHTQNSFSSWLENLHLKLERVVGWARRCGFPLTLKDLWGNDPHSQRVVAPCSACSEHGPWWTGR